VFLVEDFPIFLLETPNCLLLLLVYLGFIFFSLLEGRNIQQAENFAQLLRNQWNRQNIEAKQIDVDSKIFEEQLESYGIKVRNFVWICK